MKVLIVIALLVLFGLVHLIKLMRLYLIVMEQDVMFERYVPAYLRTTFVNLIVPYKLGEIYRVGVMSRITGSFKIGFFSTLVDRFFDTLSLVLIILPYQLFISGKVTVPIILLFAFLVIMILFYILYPSTYRYLNRFIIMNRTSGRSMTALKWLEGIHEWYEYVRQLVTGRYGLLIMFSFVAWIFEFGVLALVSKLLGQTFDIQTFGDYISGILGGSTGRLGRVYTIGAAAVILVAAIVSLIVYAMKKKKAN